MGLGLLGTPMTRVDGIKDLLKDRIGAPVLNVSSRLDPGNVRGNYFILGVMKYPLRYKSWDTGTAVVAHNDCGEHISALIQTNNTSSSCLV